MDDISDGDVKRNNLGRNNVVHFPDATVFAHLKACQKITADHTQNLFDDFHSELDEKLQEFVDKAKSNEEGSDLQETIRTLQHNGSQLRQQFAHRLNDGFVRFKEKRLNSRTGEKEYRSDVLSLVDNEDLEEIIALSSVAQRAEEQFGEALWLVNQRLAVLNGGDKVYANNNPISPIQFCEALRKALSKLSLDTKSKIIAYKVFDAELVNKLPAIIGDVNQYLAGQDVLPDLHHTAANSQQPNGGDSGGLEEASAAPYEQESGQNPAPEPQARVGTSSGGLEPSSSAQGLARGLPEGNLVQAIRNLQHHLAEAGSDGAASGGNAGAGNPAQAPGQAHVPSSQAQANGMAPSPGGAAAPSNMMNDVGIYSNQQLVAALQALQARALSLTTVAADASAGMAPQNVALVNHQLTEQLKEESDNGDVDPDDMHTIDLVGMLFEYMLSDDRLPDSVKTILSYLHTPILKVAFLDSSFFEKDEHPARLLLNSLAEAGTRWVGNDGTSQYDIYSRVREVVSRVLDEFENDVRLFAELLLEFSSNVKKIARRQELMEKRVMEKVQGEEKLREVKVRVNREIRSRTDGTELPSAILLLLLQPWSDYLAFVLLRYGDESESWQTGIAAVDELIWSIEAKQDEDKNRMERLDDLLDTIESGCETIGYDQSKSSKLISALVSLQKMATESKKPEPAPPPMRDKLENEAAERAGGEEDATTGRSTPEEKKMVENLKMIEFGTWFEFEGGKRLKVAWYNSKTMHYMLVDQTGKKVAMKSGLELAREMLSGRARVIAGSTKPLFERALENILENLNAQAEAIRPENDND